MDLPEDENIEWLMQSSATVEKVVDDDDAQKMRNYEAKQEKLFLQILKASFENEPTVDGAVAVGVVKCLEQLLTLLRKLKALGYFYFIRTSRDNKPGNKVLLKKPAHIPVCEPYAVDRTTNFYCSSGKAYTKQMRERLNSEQRVTTDCAAAMTVKQVTIFCNVTIPKARRPRLRALQLLRKNIAAGNVPTRSEMWVWISLPRMHHHPVILPGRPMDHEVKAAMHSLLQKGVKTRDQIQAELRRIVDKEFRRGPVKPGFNNTAFYPSQKVIYNHLRHEGLERKKYQRKNNKLSSIRHETLNRLTQLLNAVENCSDLSALQEGANMMNELERLLKTEPDDERCTNETAQTVTYYKIHVL